MEKLLSYVVRERLLSTLQPNLVIFLRLGAEVTLGRWLSAMKEGWQEGKSLVVHQAPDLVHDETYQWQPPN